MAIEKTLNTRIQLKYDTLANWNASTFNLKKGEIALVEVPTAEGSTLQPVMFKVGVGNKKFSELDWASAKAADVYGWAKKPQAEFETYVKGLVDTVPFSNYYTKAEVDALLKAITDAASLLAGRVKSLEDKYDVDKKLSVIISELEGKIAAVDTGVMSVSGKDAIVAAGDDAVEVSLKINATPGNVVLSQDANGLKAEVDLSNHALKSEIRTDDEIKNIAATEIGRLIDVAGDDETLKNIGALVDYVEDNAADIAQLVTDVGTANTNASNAVATANTAAADASTAKSDAAQAKSDAASAVEIANEAKTGAANSAAAAAESAADAADSASQAADSAADALAEAGKAANSASAAASAKDEAVQAKADALIAQGKAEAAQSAAAASESAAAASASAASNSASAASTSAQQADTSANQASTHAETASTKAGEAAASASAAATSETNAGKSATAADNSAKAAAQSATDAANEKAAAEQAKADANTILGQVTDAATGAQATANAAVQTANSASTVAGEAKTAAENAVSTANNAKAVADTAVQTVAAGDGLKATRGENNDVTIGFDPDVVFVFDCGSATTLID